MQDLSQGALLYGIKSEKYPGSRCYGIIISARCDIANKKIARLYYLIALDAREWLTTQIGFSFALEQPMSNAKKQFGQKVVKRGLNVDDLLTFTPEMVEHVLKSEMKEKESIDALKDYNEYIRFCSLYRETRYDLIKEKLKHVLARLKEINSGKWEHWYYLPEVAYLKSGKKSKGLIVDLQELYPMAFEDAELICEGRVDRHKLNLGLDKKTLEHFSHFCYLEEDDDYVSIDSIIASPWCEHLMQRFSNAFIRIGLDGATEKDFTELITSIQQEGV